MENIKNPLLEPVKIAGKTARNRVVMAPMATNFASTDDEVTDAQVAYYAERARGGMGTIIVEAASIRREAPITARQLGTYDDGLIPGLARLAGAIKAEGVVAILQLCHGGPKILSTAGLRTESVSSVGIRPGNTPRILTSADLRQVRREFIGAAYRANKAGFDGVELHAAHFYLLSASISPFTNKRTDEYGGSLENRVRLTREIVEELKAELGAECPVLVRLHACEATDPGLSLEEGQNVAGILSQAGADAIHVSAYTLPISESYSGMAIRFGAAPVKDTPPGPFLDYAGAIKRAVDVPVIAVGKLDDPAIATMALAEGKCDMIALGRQLICDPYWARKVEEGRKGEIVHCSYCLTCHKAQQSGEDLRCSQNMNMYGEPVYKGHKVKGMETER